MAHSWLLGPAVGLVLLVLLLPPTVPAPPAGAGPGVAVPPYTEVAYSSSVDAWPLSYAEFLPAHFSPDSSYRLVVFLHGMMATGPRWASGGVPSSFLTQLGQTSAQGAVARALVANASTYGYIFIALNTRTGAGFYANTPCGGPQEQDVLDAVAHESALRHITATYLIGFSMGTIGAFGLAADHPGVFAGIAVAGTNTDRFAGHAWREYAAAAGQAWAVQSIKVSLQSTCGVGPGQGNATVDAIFERQSVARLHPAALAGTRMWVAAGGADAQVPNNAKRFAFMQVNNTFVNASTWTFYDETTPPAFTFWDLHNASPRAFDFRYIFEKKAAHSPAQFDPADIFAYFQGRVPWGFYTSPTVPPTVIVPNPHPGR